MTNFERTLPAATSDLAQELTKDPYDFAFTGITGRYNEKLLKDSLLNNITRFLVELGTGFATLIGSALHPALPGLQPGHG